MYLPKYYNSHCGTLQLIGNMHIGPNGLIVQRMQPPVPSYGESDSGWTQ